VASLPQFNSNDKDFQMMQNRWASILNPIINNPVNRSSILSSISLIAGSNVINHLLSRKLQGWSIVRINAASTIYDAQDSNQNPDQTLVLVSSAPCVVSIEVF
jgi:hypothetical protein